MLSSISRHCSQQHKHLSSWWKVTIMISRTTGITSRIWSSSWMLMFCSFKDVNWKMWWKWSNQQSMILSVNISILVRALKQVVVMKVCPKNLLPHQKPTSWPEFLIDMLTPEVRTNISNTIKHMEASHNEAAKVMKCMKKLITTIPVSAFHLML